jgi:predicted nucleotidyltransferase
MNFLQNSTNNMQNIIRQDILEQFDAAMQAFGVKFYLIGAKARDLWLAIKDIKPRRYTVDIDFAISLENMQQYEELLTFLEKTGNFIKDKNIPQRIYTADNEFMIDLLPFGKIENAYYIIFHDKDNTQMSTLGLQEVFTKSLPFQFENKLEILAASLPGIVILKLIAWNDKPESRNKDLKDIAFIIDNYFNLQDDLIYEKYNRYFENDLKIDQIAAIALGCEIKEILAISNILSQAVLDILQKHITLNSDSPMVQIMAAELDVDADKIIESLNLILQGINE